MGEGTRGKAPGACFASAQGQGAGSHGNVRPTRGDDRAGLCQIC